MSKQWVILSQVLMCQLNDTTHAVQRVDVGRYEEGAVTLLCA
jgi:hypothetical protein